MLPEKQSDGVGCDLSIVRLQWRNFNHEREHGARRQVSRLAMEGRWRRSDSGLSYGLMTGSICPSDGLLWTGASRGAR